MIPVTAIGHRGSKEHTQEALDTLKKHWPGHEFGAKPTGNGSFQIMLAGQPAAMSDLQRMRSTVEAAGVEFGNPEPRFPRRRGRGE